MDFRLSQHCLEQKNVIFQKAPLTGFSQCNVEVRVIWWMADACSAGNPDWVTSLGNTSSKKKMFSLKHCWLGNKLMEHLLQKRMFSLKHCSNYLPLNTDHWIYFFLASKIMLNTCVWYKGWLQNVKIGPLLVEI